MPTAEPRIPVALSTSSVYPLGAAEGFSMAADLGYDGMEVMVTHRAETQQADVLNELSWRFGLPVMAIHAPTLLLTQQVWGSAWEKLRRSAKLAAAVGCATVVAHPPFRWQAGYAEGFADGIAKLEQDTGVHFAVENMYPWKAGGRTAAMYLPHWDPVGQAYPHVTWDFSHAATAEADSLDSCRRLGGRLRHVHLTDGWSNGFKDDHLIPGHGEQPVAETLELIASPDFADGQGFRGVVAVEVATRAAKQVGEKERWLAESLEFARRHLARGAASADGAGVDDTADAADTEEEKS
ncbi:sugar phosphate isomerase/epimerase [Nesterenkonia sp. CL21]|uniref:sugar phosphate isomerase/epimerase family protein n=1 Tax=Nesterenkonia sp. CL21 TaxID=3064894 RepID=UPI00287B2D15|nr:sugar phosphate isomerase/epimerase [Nesterenkonia sp. CL21]MDS2171091.1 sugar phosphate isomerase/epimerase [Nesterenkonia sp. CL21]